MAVYLSLNMVTIGVGLYEIFGRHPEALANWKSALFTTPDVNSSVIMIALMALFYFPKLALGLSGFETGVVVMPLVKGDDNGEEDKGEDEIHLPQMPERRCPGPAQPVLEGRIRNGKKLLTWAAVIMSFLLIGSSVITTMLIPPKEFQEGGQAYGRALSYLAHGLMGEGFGTFYDISTVLILWFAGASAMAGLLNIVPRYLPRYGMAPDWARATRPLVLVFTVICFLVTVVFNADVTSQGGAYATGVLMLMSSAAVAVTISAWRKGQKAWLAYMAITLVFFYTTIVNMIEQPDGIKIASLFIFCIIFASFVSRALRTTEIRIDEIVLDEKAQEFLDEFGDEDLRIVTNRRETGDVSEYRFKEHEKRVDNHIPSTSPVVFLEVELGDASEFKGKLKIRGVDIDGYKILRTEASAVPNAIAGFLMYLRDKTGKIPHVYFGWSEGNPIMYLARYILFGEGDTAPVTERYSGRPKKTPNCARTSTLAGKTISDLGLRISDLRDNHPGLQLHPS